MVDAIDQVTTALATVASVMEVPGAEKLADAT